MKKFNLEVFYKNLLMVSGSVTILIGMLNELRKAFSGYEKKAVEVYDSSRRVVERVQMSVPPSFFQDHWQMFVIAVGVVMIIVGIVINKRIKKRSSSHG